MSWDSASRGFLLCSFLAAVAIPILECDGLGAGNSQRMKQRSSSRASPRSRLAEKDEQNTVVSRQRARLGANNFTVLESMVKKPAVKTVKWAKVGGVRHIFFPAACFSTSGMHQQHAPLHPLPASLSKAIFDMPRITIAVAGCCGQGCAAHLKDVLPAPAPLFQQDGDEGSTEC